MNEADPERLFLEEAKCLLDEGLEDLGNRTGQGLREIRIQALNCPPGKRAGFFLPFRWTVAGGIATATLAAVALFFWLHSPSGDFPTKHIEDLEILAANERIDFYQNLDFYRWLGAREKTAH